MRAGIIAAAAEEALNNKRVAVTVRRDWAAVCLVCHWPIAIACAPRGCCQVFARPAARRLRSRRRGAGSRPKGWRRRSERDSNRIRLRRRKEPAGPGRCRAGLLRGERSSRAGTDRFVSGGPSRATPLGPPGGSRRAPKSSYQRRGDTGAIIAFERHPGSAPLGRGRRGELVESSSSSSAASLPPPRRLSVSIWTSVFNFRPAAAAQ